MTAENSAIAGVGAYVPRFRLSAAEVEDALGRFRARGVDSVAVPDADEDALTMAAEAGERALDAAGYEAGSVDALFLASTTLPYDEEAGSGRLGSLLGVGETTRTSQFGGSTAAGGEALSAALDGGGVALVVAADCPQGALDEAVGHAAGAGACAIVCAPDSPGAVTDRSSYTATYPGTRFRKRGSDETTGLGVTAYDREAYRETVAGAVDELGGANDPDAAALQAPDGDLPYRAARALGLDSETVAAGTVADEVGDAGAASALLGFADAVADGSETILVVTYGSGGAAHAFRVEGGEIPVRRTVAGDRDLDFAAAQRRCGAFDSGVPEGGGAYVSVPSYRRTLPQRHRLVAGRCRACGALRFPPEGACTECGASEGYDDTPLSKRGTVEAVTTISQGGAPPEFAEQQARSGDYAAAIVALETDSGDETVSAPAMGTDADPADFSVGDRIETTIRRIYTQEGVTRYGFKIRPASE